MWENSSAFWAQRDMWRATSVKKTASARTDLNLQEKANRWAVKSEQYLRASPKVSGWVQFNSDQIRASLAAHIERLGPALAQAFDETLPFVAALAFQRWPVRSGFSKSTIQLYYFDRGGDDFGGGVAVTAPYALFIKGNPTLRLIGQPMRAVRADLGPKILAGVSRG